MLEKKKRLDRLDWSIVLRWDINGCLLKVFSLHLALLVTKDEGTLRETNLKRHASNSRNPVRVSHFLDRAFLSLPFIKILLLRDFQQTKLNTWLPLIANRFSLNWTLHNKFKSDDKGWIDAQENVYFVTVDAWLESIWESTTLRGQQDGWKLN